MVKINDIVKVKIVDHKFNEKMEYIEIRNEICKVKIIDKWDDYETGLRFKGKTKDKKEIYFTQWDLVIPTYKTF